MQSYWSNVTRRRIGRRKFLAATAATSGALALSLAGCSGGEDSGSLSTGGAIRLEPGAFVFSRDYWQLPDETAQAVPGGIFRGRTTADLQGTLDIHKSAAAAIQGVGGQVYERFVEPNFGRGIKPGSAESRQMIGALAESWEVADTSSTWTFTMRPNVRFHNVDPVNGRLMDIEDWRSTWDKFISVGYYKPTMESVVDKVEFPDTRRMVMKLKTPFITFLDLFRSYVASFLITPKELNANDDLAAAKMIGTRSRVLSKNQPSVTLEYARHDNFWRGKPFIDRWHEPIVQEYANAYAQFIAGNITVFTPLAKDALQMRSDVAEAVMVGTEPTLATIQAFGFGKVNLEKSPFADARVRIALRKSVDWDAVDAFFTNKDSFAARGIEVDIRTATSMPPDLDYWLDPKKNELGEASKNYFYDLAEAKKLLAAAGFPNGVQVDAYANGGGNYGQAYEDRVNVFSDQLNKSGTFKLNVKRVPYQTYLNDILFAPNFEGLRMAHVWSAYQRGADNLLRVWHSSSPVDTSAGRFPDPHLDDLSDQFRREGDPQKRVALIHDYQKYMAKQMYIVPCDSNAGGFTFRWPWVHNVGLPDHLQWLDPNMPRRNAG